MAELLAEVPEPASAEIISGVNMMNLMAEGEVFHVPPPEKLDFSDDDIDLFEDVNEDTSNKEDWEYYDFTTKRDSRILPIDSTFDVLAETMINVDAEGLVKKQIIKTGSGKEMRELCTYAMVTIHYQMYSEGSDEPFDSTRLRRQRHTFQLGQGNVIPGLDEAVASMRHRELARFLIYWQKAYGKYGILTRIPPEANLAVEVELLEFEALSESETPSSLFFANAMKQAKDFQAQGLQLSGKGNFKQAAGAYHKARKICQSVQLLSAEEEQIMTKRLIKLHVSLAHCYNKLNKRQQACAQSRQALLHDPYNVKALFNYGRANLHLNNFVTAADFLKRALKLEPESQEIKEELKLVDKKHKESLAETKQFCVRIFGGPTKANDEEEQRELALIKEGGATKANQGPVKEDRNNSSGGK